MMAEEPLDGPTLGQNRGFRAIHHTGRHPDRGAAGRHVAGDHRVRPDLGILADADVAKDGYPAADEDATSDPRRAAGIVLLSADSDVLVDRHLVADGDQRADD